MVEVFCQHGLESLVEAFSDARRAAIEDELRLAVGLDVQIPVQNAVEAMVGHRIW